MTMMFGAVAPRGQDYLSSHLLRRALPRQGASNPLQLKGQLVLRGSKVWRGRAAFSVMLSTVEQELQS